MLTVEQAVSEKRHWDGVKFRILYEFKCAQCGSAISKRVGQLAKSTGLCRRCACARPNVRLQKRPHEWRFNNLVSTAKKREVLVTLTYEDYLSFTSITNCHYCDGYIDWSFYKRNREHGGGRSWGSNLDRKDNSKGYEIGNCVVCCGFCNRIKNNHLSYEEMLRLSPVLREIVAGRQQEIR